MLPKVDKMILIKSELPEKSKIVYKTKAHGN